MLLSCSGLSSLSNIFCWHNRSNTMKVQKRLSRTSPNEGTNLKMHPANLLKSLSLLGTINCNSSLGMNASFQASSISRFTDAQPWACFLQVRASASLNVLILSCFVNSKQRLMEWGEGLICCWVFSGNSELGNPFANTAQGTFRNLYAFHPEYSGSQKKHPCYPNILSC